MYGLPITVHVVSEVILPLTKVSASDVFDRAIRKIRITDNWRQTEEENFGGLKPFIF